jgi:hypothetical protein
LVEKPDFHRLSTFVRNLSTVGQEVNEHLLYSRSKTRTRLELLERSKP